MHINAKDESGPAIKEALKKSNLDLKFIEHVVPDEKEEISKMLIYLCEDVKAALILTTGNK